jgi:sterol desaturase/sphingolipid hydroxylase (fatty acid hydroxylase superfamily)
MELSLPQFQASAGKILLLLFLSTIVYGLAEMLYLRFSRKVARMREYRTTASGLIFALLISIGVTAVYGRVNTAIIAVGAAPLALFKTDLSWYWWIYGLVIYEFWYFVQHYLAHKVRLLWCIHSPHHAPEAMNMFVGFNHSFIESLFYMPLFLGFFPVLFGVRPEIVIVWGIVDAIWGSMIHISDHVLPGRLGILERFLQTPSYHRAHHARNVRYMDTNYTSITLLWDYLFRTLQPLRDDEPVQYGITRRANTDSFLDTHFGELQLLWQDVWAAPSLKNKILYLIMPPGWSHTGASQTAAILKRTMN